MFICFIWWWVVVSFSTDPNWDEKKVLTRCRLFVVVSTMKVHHRVIGGRLLAYCKLYIRRPSNLNWVVRGNSNIWPACRQESVLCSPKLFHLSFNWVVKSGNLCAEWGSLVPLNRRLTIDLQIPQGRKTSTRTKQNHKGADPILENNLKQFWVEVVEENENSCII